MFRARRPVGKRVEVEARHRTLTREPCQDRARTISKLKQITDQRLLRFKETLLEYVYLLLSKNAGNSLSSHPCWIDLLRISQDFTVHTEGHHKADMYSDRQDQDVKKLLSL